MNTLNVLKSYSTCLSDTKFVYSFTTLKKKVFRYYVVTIHYTPKRKTTIFDFPSRTPPTTKNEDDDPPLDLILSKFSNIVLSPCTYTPFTTTLIYPHPSWKATQFHMLSAPNTKN